MHGQLVKYINNVPVTKIVLKERVSETAWRKTIIYYAWNPFNIDEVVARAYSLSTLTEDLDTPIFKNVLRSPFGSISALISYLQLRFKSRVEVLQLMPDLAVLHLLYGSIETNSSTGVKYKCETEYIYTLKRHSIYDERISINVVYAKTSEHYKTHERIVMNTTDNYINILMTPDAIMTICKPLFRIDKNKEA